MPDNQPILLAPADFEQYSSNWVQLINQGDQAVDALRQCFAAPDGARLAYLSMPASWVGNLLSTVGCVQVKARFALNKNKQFNLAFYAVDAQNSRVSAYYLLSLETTEYGNLMARMYGQNSPADTPPVSSGDAGSGSVQIPHGMAGDWIRSWQEVGKLTPDLFSTSYGFLQGYCFERGDLLDNLFNVVRQEQQQLRVDFGLHKYYAGTDTASTPQPTYTFGLVLRLVNPDATTSDTPFYDMSTPVPPCY
jgi:hypothetical protein